MKNIVIGLFCLMISNMILNLTLDKIKGELSLSNFLESLLKGAIIFLGSLLIYYAGYLNPTILAINMDGMVVNLDDALKMVYVAGIILYGYKSITKLSELLNVDVNIEENIALSLEDANNVYPDEELALENDIEEVEEINNDSIPNNNEVYG